MGDEQDANSNKLQQKDAANSPLAEVLRSIVMDGISTSANTVNSNNAPNSGSLGF